MLQDNEMNAKHSKGINPPAAMVIFGYIYIYIKDKIKGYVCWAVIAFSIILEFSTVWWPSVHEQVLYKQSSAPRLPLVELGLFNSPEKD